MVEVLTLIAMIILFHFLAKHPMGDILNNKPKTNKQDDDDVIEYIFRNNEF